MNKPLQFHWRLISAGESNAVTRTQQLETNAVAFPDITNQTAFCEKAVEAGMESLLVNFDYAKPDPMMLSAVLATLEKQMKFLIAMRSGIISPTYFVQQVNTFAAATQGRILLNIVAGYSPTELKSYGDFLAHKNRYERTEEFLSICNSLWHHDEPLDFEGKYYQLNQAKIRTSFIAPNRNAPYIFVAGGSDNACQLAIRQGDCWMRFLDKTEKLAKEIIPVLKARKEVGLRFSVIIRQTKKAAIKAAL